VETHKLLFTNLQGQQGFPVGPDVVGVVSGTATHPALIGQSHVSNLVFQCNFAGHLLQWATPLLQ